MSLLRTTFRIGPVLMVVPTLAWATVWYLALQGENDSWYIVWPLIGFFAAVIIWHIALLILEKNRFAYIAYAIVFMPAFYILYGLALIFATHFPL
jgi:hypothetical protein